MKNTPLVDLIALTQSMRFDKLTSLSNVLEGLVIKEARVVDGKLRLYLAKLETVEVTKSITEEIEDYVECSHCNEETWAYLSGNFDVDVETQQASDNNYLILTVSLDSYEYLR
jgi:hypothetical protein